MRRFLIALGFLGWLGMAPGLAAEKPLLVASIRPLALMAGDLGGDWLEVRQLLKDNQEPHHVALTISQRRLIEEAQLILWVGPTLENYLADGVRGRPAGAALSLEDIAASHFADRDMGGDAHLWLEPDIVRGVYRELAGMLAARYPQRRAAIEARLDRVLVALDDRVAAIAAEFADLGTDRGVPLVDHQAYGYFMEYFGIPLAGALVDARGVPAGARSLAALEATANASCLVVERLPPTRRASQLAERLGLKLVAIDPLATAVPVDEGYLGLIEDMASGFRACLLAGQPVQ